MVLVLMYYILYYYYSKNKTRGKARYAQNILPVTSGQGHFRSGPLPITWLPVAPHKYDFVRTLILLSSNHQTIVYIKLKYICMFEVDNIRQILFFIYWGVRPLLFPFCFTDYSFPFSWNIKTVSDFFTSIVWSYGCILLDICVREHLKN